MKEFKFTLQDNEINELKQQIEELKNSLNKEKNVNKSDKLRHELHLLFAEKRQPLEFGVMDALVDYILERENK
jgi:hypothetical protein